MTYLSNARIRLRALEPEDLDMLYRWENDASLWYLGNTIEPFSKYILKEYIAYSDKNIFEKHQLRLMIETVTDGTTVGCIDLFDFDPHAMRAGVGVLIDPEFQHQGYATDALRILVKYAFGFLRIHQLYAHVPVLNLPSQKLFDKVGFTVVGTLHDWVKVGADYQSVTLFQLISK